MNRKVFEKKDMEYFESQGYACIRAIPNVKMINNKYISHRQDFFNVADIIAFKKDKEEVIFIQVTSSDTKLEKDMRRSLLSHKKKIKDLYNLPYTMILMWHYKFNNRWHIKKYIYKNNNWIDDEL